MANSSFIVTATFSEVVQPFNASDFILSNTELAEVQRVTGTVFTLTFLSSPGDDVSVQMDGFGYKVGQQTKPRTLGTPLDRYIHHHTHMHASTDTHTHVHMHARTCAHTHTHTHMHAHTHALAHYCLDNFPDNSPCL